MSQAAPVINQHPHHHSMVGGTSEGDGPSQTTTDTDTTERTASIVTPSNEDSAPRTSTSPTSSRSHPHSRDSASTNTQSRHELRESASGTYTRPSTAASDRTQSYQSHNINQHSRGFDQSGFPLTSDPQGLACSPSSPRLQPTYRSTRSLGDSEATSPSRIKVRDLSHIQSFASEEYLARPRLPGRTGSNFPEVGRQYEISSMPVTDIIEMVAGLLTKITTTNDRQHEHLHRPIPPPEEQGNLNPQASCVLAFHGKNVPSITILSYLSRIHKYCPTTYEVFLSLLVYFDRMTETVNKSFMVSMESQNQDPSAAASGSQTPGSLAMNIDNQTPPNSGATPRSDLRSQVSMPPSPPGGPAELSQFFVVDSYNIHRLVIAGVTCASKFFSDVFYTNSRYAKVRMLLWPHILANLS